MDSRLVLPVNTVLDGSYRIMRVVGSGGFGITYEAEDIGLGTTVAVKEYYPFDFGDRDATMSVRPKSERHKQTFDWGRSNFLQEARTLARFEHPSIVRVTRVFEAHATAYMVMRFEQGMSFEVWLGSLHRPPTQEELDAVTSPILDALEVMHTANFLHRDIAPDNIIVRADGTPVLLDFGAARRAVAEMSRTLTGIVKAGYSPHEQYSSDGRLQGPWSDLYALGGTLYRAVAGKPPEEATLRFDDDSMASAARAAKGKYRPGFLAAIDTCLKVRHAERPRSVAQLRPMLLGRRSQPRPTQRLIEPTFKLPTMRMPSLPRLPKLSSLPKLSKLPKLTGLPKKLTSLPKLTGLPKLASLPKSVTVQNVARRWPAIAATVAILGGAYGGYAYQHWHAPEREGPGIATATSAREAEVRRKVVEAAQRQAALDDEKRQKEKEAADARQRQIEVEETRRRNEQAEAKRQADIAEVRRKAEVAAEQKRKEELRVAALDDARRKAEEARRKADADEKARIAAQDEARRKESDQKRNEQQRIAALEEARRDEEKHKEDERLRLAALPNDGARTEFVRKIQLVLKKSHCYGGAVNGISKDTQEGLDRFVETASKTNTVQPQRIELAKATVGDFETFLKDATAVKGGQCPAEAKPEAQQQKSEPVAKVRRQRETPERHYAPRQSSPSYSRPSGVGPIQGIQ